MSVNIINLRNALIKDASETHIGYPQYDGFFDNWRLGVFVGDRFVGKAGSEIVRGEIVLTSIKTTDPLVSQISVYVEGTGNVVGMPSFLIVPLPLVEL